jgi:zinc/manganese transport system substrate-binding protein
VRRSAIKLAIGLAAVALAAVGCSRQRTRHDHDAVSVVASTDVWGSVASAVAASTRRSSRSRPARADPHSFEATPATSPRSTDASLVVYNGGGYDHWVDGVLAGDPEIDASTPIRCAAPHEPANEHVFYDVGVAKAVAEEVAKRLSRARPAHAERIPGQRNDIRQQADASPSRARDRQGTPVGICRRDRAGRVLPAAQRRDHRPHPSRLRKRGRGG